MQALADDLYEQVFKCGGTISGEHGSGYSRTWFLRKQFGPLLDVFREVKRIFDPQNLLNPGKVVTDTPQPITKNLRLFRPNGDSTEPPQPVRAPRLPTAAPLRPAQSHWICC